ncbi:MAG: NUDIX domain-containing protein [Elusimicrobiota bacterium]
MALFWPRRPRSKRPCLFRARLDMRHEFSAGGVVLMEKNLALIQVANLKGDKVWTFPKGHLEANEEALEAALREVEEETGWRCRSLGPLTTVNYRFSRQGVPVSKRVEWFLMEPVEKIGDPDPLEVLAMRWSSSDEARSLVSYPTDLQLLELVKT